MISYQTTVTPVLSSSKLSSCPVLSTCLQSSNICTSYLLSVIFTSIEQLPFKESKRPLCIFFHLYWMVTLNKSTQIKLRIIFQVKFDPYLNPEINVSSIFEQVYWTIMAWSDIFLKIFFFCHEYPYSVELVLSSHLAIPCKWPLNTGSTVPSFLSC